MTEKIILRINLNLYDNISYYTKKINKNIHHTINYDTL